MVWGVAWNDAVHGVHGGIFEDAGGIAVRIADDGAAGRLGGGAGDAGELEGERVGEAHVAVEAVDEDGVVAGTLVDQLARGEAGGGPGFMVPIAAQDPAAGGQFGGEGADALAEFGFAIGIA